MLIYSWNIFTESILKAKTKQQKIYKRLTLSITAGKDYKILTSV